MPLTLEYQSKIENCLIYIDASLSKTKSPDILLLTFSNIEYTDINNLKYLEKEQLNLMITLEIDTIVSNFSYELTHKSSYGST